MQLPSPSFAAVFQRPVIPPSARELESRLQRATRLRTWAHLASDRLSINDLFDVETRMQRMDPLQLEEKT